MGVALYTKWARTLYNAQCNGQLRKAANKRRSWQLLREIYPSCSLKLLGRATPEPGVGGSNPLERAIFAPSNRCRRASAAAIFFFWANCARRLNRVSKRRTAHPERDLSDRDVHYLPCCVVHLSRPSLFGVRKFTCAFTKGACSRFHAGNPRPRGDGRFGAVAGLMTEPRPPTGGLHLSNVVAGLCPPGRRKAPAHTPSTGGLQPRQTQRCGRSLPAWTQEGARAHSPDRRSPTRQTKSFPPGSLKGCHN